MASTQERKAPAVRLDALCDVAELSDDARALMTPTHSPKDFLNVMVEAEAFPDAVRYLAHLIPRRAAIWWAWTCARGVSGESPADPVASALRATEAWLTQPTEAHRRAAMAAAERAEFTTPAGCAALAVFFSGGSIGPPDAPEAPPGDYVTAKAVAGSILLAAVAKEPERAKDHFQTFIKHGREVADRFDVWAQL